MKNILRRIHIYGGLFFFPLFMIFGFSALHINHDIKVFNPGQKWTETSRHINIPLTRDKQRLAESIRDSLGLTGWCPYWTHNLSKDRFRFEIVHNGAEYKIDANLESGEIGLKRKSKGAGNIFESLHAFNEDIPSGPWIINSWKYYKDLGFFYIIAAILSGLYFTFIKRSGRKSVVILISLSLIFTIFMTLYIWMAG